MHTYILQYMEHKPFRAYMIFLWDLCTHIKCFHADTFYLYRSQVGTTLPCKVAHTLLRYFARIVRNPTL